jgi:DNA-3-methyladenine glycosylase II
MFSHHPDADTIARARRELAARDPAIARMDAAVGPLPWRSLAPGFATLVQMVMGQQVSTASADAIWRRLEAGLGQVTPETVLAQDADTLRALGLSRQKARYAHAIAEARLDFGALARMDEEAAVAEMTRITGVGRWTAELYLLMAEGRADAFPAGDLALQVAMHGAEDWAGPRPAEKALRARAEPWRPWRGVVAHLLWAYYRTLPRRPA